MRAVIAQQRLAHLVEQVQRGDVAPKSAILLNSEEDMKCAQPLCPMSTHTLAIVFRSAWQTSTQHNLCRLMRGIIHVGMNGAWVPLFTACNGLVMAPFSICRALSAIRLLQSMTSIQIKEVVILEYAIAPTGNILVNYACLVLDAVTLRPNSHTYPSTDSQLGYQST